VVSFVGGQNSSYFTAEHSIPPAAMFPGVVAQAVNADLPGTPFYDLYHDWFGLGEPVLASDDLTQGAVKTIAYFNAKLFFNASLCVAQRDRFVIFLKRKLDSAFRLIGPRWRETYGLQAERSLASTDEYFDHFRKVAINLNLVNGNAETGLNMRHFEITAAGGFMMCYRHPELESHFVPGRECVVFDSESDLIEKAAYYLAHPQERVEIALAGQQRTLSEHLFSHRLDAVLKLAQDLKIGSDAAESNESIAAHSPRGLKPAAQDFDNACAARASIVVDSVDPSAGATPALHGSPVEFSAGRWQDDFTQVVPEADIILDCGANIGQMATAFRQLYPSATIYSFEPVSAVFEQLKIRCAKLDVQPVKKAVSDHDGRQEINLTYSAEANSLLKFEPGNPCAQWTQEIGAEEVAVCTLDRWCAENDIELDRVDVIKLDVQGAELSALKGATQLLRAVKLVYLEVSFVPIYKGCPLFADIEAFMVEHAFVRRSIYPSDQPQNWGDAVYVRV
jgi:FkbM family methyltransferase